MPELPGAEAAARRGLAFLEKNQETDGSFVSFSSASTRPFRRLRSWRTTFVPALMLASLAGLDEAAALGIRERLAGFLLKQKDLNWSFNYWARSAPERKTQPYPNDLDDTFCALAGLYLHDPAIINGAVLAKAVKLLLATEAATGGPYRTWLVPADSELEWLDVDLAVNSNIAYFLSLVSNGLPKLDGLMSEAIESDIFSSPYYPSEHALVYYFARSYGGPYKNRLLAKARRLYKQALTDLDRALCLSARLWLGETRNLTGLASELLSGQRRDGSWAAAAFYADPVNNGKLYYDGSQALTTAFALEALGLYRHYQAGKDTVSRVGDNKVQAAILKMADRQCCELPANLRTETLRLAKKLISSDNGPEIISLPQSFNQSLLKPLSAKFSAFLNELGLANLYGWMAYTIYDDFLDEEGKPRLLPVANVTMRKSLDGFLGTLPKDQAYRALVRRVFDSMDGANAWEQAYCRFERHGDDLTVGRLPDYGDFSKLAERSLGHTLSAMAILSATGLSVDDASCQQIAQALRHYLIVRQLNDDLHDWAEDLRDGHITPVVADILLGLGIKPGGYPLPELLADGRRQFWHRTLPKMCRLMRQHVRSSRSALRNSGSLKPEDTITKLLDKLEMSIDSTLAQRNQAEDFLKHYGRKALNLEA